MNKIKFYIHTETGCVDTQEGWEETLRDLGEEDECFGKLLEECDKLVEVRKSVLGDWVTLDSLVDCSRRFPCGNCVECLG